MGDRHRRWAAIGALALLATTPAAGADLRPDKVPAGPLRVAIRPMAVPPPPVIPVPVAPVDPYEGLGLLQRLALLFSEAFVPTQYTALPPEPAAAPALTDEPSMEIIAYSGPLAPGIIVVNMTQRQIFRILDGGWAELHRNRTDVASFFKTHDSH